MVRNISYKGKKYPIRIGYKAIKGVNAELGRDFKGDAESFDFEGAEALLYHGMKQGCSFAEHEFDLKREDMEDVLDESLDEFIAAFQAFSQEAQKAATQGLAKK